MEAPRKTELIDVEKKLTELKTRLDSLLKIVWGTENVNSVDVLPAVNELLSLLEWAAQKPDVWPQGAMLFMQLQGLQKIKQNLETTSNKVEDDSNEDEKAQIAIEQQRTDLPQEGKSSTNDLPSSNEPYVCSNVTHNDELCHLIQASPSEESPVVGKIEEISPDNNLLLPDDDNFNYRKANDVSRVNNSDRYSKLEKEVDVLNLVSSGIGNLIKTNEEIKELLASNAASFGVCNSVLSRTGDSQTPPSSELRDLLSSDIKDAESNIDVMQKALNTSTNTVSGPSDLLLDGIIVKNETSNSIHTDYSKLLTEPEELAELTSKESPAIKQHNTNPILSDKKNELLSLMENNEDIVKPETVLKQMFLNNLDILTQPDAETQRSSASKLKSNIELDDIFVYERDFCCRSTAEVKDLVMPDDSKTLQGNSEISSLNLPATPTVSVGETKESVHTDKEPGLIDLLTSSDDTSMKNIEEIERCKSPNLLNSIQPVRNEIVVLETNDTKSSDLVHDPKITKDPLDICMFAIRNLYDNLRAKENELLKLSVIQSDQKHIEALQAVIVDFHKEITNLNSRLDIAKKENSTLKEQVLELEEAENDARSNAQKFELKLSFLQEKDLHSQNEISHLKKSLKHTSEKLLEKEKTEKELRSHIKYMETLVQKYEDQIKEIEAKENANIPNDKKPESDPGKSEEAVTCERGTQTYPFQKKLDSEIFSPTDHSTLTDQESHDTQTKETVDDSDADKKTFLCSDTPQIEDQYVITIQDGVSLKEFNDKLCKLMHEDMKIHSMGQIDLELWKKLQSLEAEVGECQRKDDINGTDLSFTAKSTDVADSPVDVVDAPPAAKETKLNLSCQSLGKRNIPTDNYNHDTESHKEEKDLKTNNDSSKEHGKEHEEWQKTENQLLSDIKELVFLKDDLVVKIEKLEIEKERLERQVSHQQTELNELKEKNQTELSKLRNEQENMCSHLQEKVNKLISEEKNLLKMIKNQKSERSNKYQAENELEILKCRYIQLQIELSNSREERRRLEQSFKVRIDECASKNKKEESRLTTELERLRQENIKCDKTIKELQVMQQKLKEELDRKEQELQTVRESFEKSLEDAKKQLQSVETATKTELQKLEEETARATTALIEERLRVEEKLQENITHLREKELRYLSRIEEMEKNMIKLHEELNKVAEKSERNRIHSVNYDSTLYQRSENAACVSSEKSKSEFFLDKYSDQWKAFESGSKEMTETPEKIVSMTYDIKQQSSAVPSTAQQGTSLRQPSTAQQTTSLRQPSTAQQTTAVRQPSTAQQSAAVRQPLTAQQSTAARQPLTAQQSTAARQPLTAQQATAVRQPSTAQHSIAARQPSTITNKDTMTVKEEDNIEDLRAQVRELQAHLEKISDDASEMPSRSQGSGISAPCMGIQKEELDFAEADESSSECRKPTLNAAPPRTPNVSQQYRPVYENRYPSRCKNKSVKDNQYPQQNSVEENVYDEILPRPTNFHVVQQVGPDALLVGWSYVNVSYLEGFEIYLDNRLHERIYIPDRTKAILSGLNLRRSFTLSIRALSRYGQLSEPASLELSCEPQAKSDGFEEEGDEYSDTENSCDKHRPYSMEW